MARGSCNCGAVIFEINRELTDVYACHCSICRKWSGTHGAAVCVVPNEDFLWVRGQDLAVSWQKPGADWSSHFCPTCGSALPGPNDGGRMFIPVGLLDQGADHLRVAAHIWVGSKASWDEIGDEAEQFLEAFGNELASRAN